MFKKLAAVGTALALAVGLSVVTASGAEAAVTNAGKFYLSPYSQSNVQVRNMSNPAYVQTVLPGRYSYNSLADVDQFYVPVTCNIVISGAQYQGGGWVNLSNSLTVRNARTYCS